MKIFCNLLIFIIFSQDDLFTGPSSSYKVNSQEINRCYKKEGMSNAIPDKKICTIYTNVKTGERVLGCAPSGNLLSNFGRIPPGGFQNNYFFRPVNYMGVPQLIANQSLDYRAQIKLTQDQVFPVIPKEILEKYLIQLEKEKDVYDYNHLNRDRKKCVYITKELQRIEKLRSERSQRFNTQRIEKKFQVKKEDYSDSTVCDQFSLRMREIKKILLQLN